MEEPKLAYLESELLRLNKLISILIEQNDTLKLKIAYLENGSASPQVYPPHLEKEIAEKYLWSRMPENEIGSEQLFSGSPQKEIGREQLFSTTRKNEIGAKQSFSGSPENEIGKEQLFKPLPYFIPLTGENISKVQNCMGVGFWFRVKQDARWAMSQILIQAYNKQGCSYTELGKLTHRSAGGMAKLIASLKKRGLVERSGKSSFRLTQLTLDYFRKVDFDLQPPAHHP